MTTLHAAWVLLRDVTFPSLRQHRLRTSLTILGVTIGALVVMAIAVLNRTILDSFERTVETIAGGADLQISNGMAGVPESLVEVVTPIPGILRASALVQGTLDTDSGDLTVFGVDLFADQQIRETQFPRKHVTIKDALVFANSPDSIALSTSFAERAHLESGATFQAVSPVGATRLTIRGWLDPVGPAALFNGAVGIVDLPTAQRLFDREGRVDQIDVAVAPGVEPSAVAERIRAHVRGVGTVEVPRKRGQRLGAMLLGVQTILTLVSLFAVVVGAFIVYHTVETATAQRRREFALVRALGCPRRAVLTAIAIEAVLYGLIGSIVGTVLGVAAARGSLALLAAGVSAIYGSVDTGRITIDSSDLLLAIGLGLACALLASLGPAVRVARMRILGQIRGDVAESNLQRPPLSVAVAGIGVAMAGYAILASGIRPASFDAKIALIMTGVVAMAAGYTLFAPTLVHLAVAAVRRVVPERATNAVLALDSVARGAARSRGAIAALMAAFAMVLIVAAFVQSLRGSIVGWIDQTFSDDLRVSPTAHLPLPGGPVLPGELEDHIRRVPGVGLVSPQRMVNVRLGNDMAVLKTVTAAGLEHEHYSAVDGDIVAARSKFGSGTVVLISDNLAYRHGLRANDSFALETPTGSHTFTVGAVVIDYTLDLGTIIVAHEAYRRLWGDDLVSSFLVWLTPGASPHDVRAAISRALLPRFRLSIVTNREFSHQISAALDNALLMTNAIQLVAVAIALIGVVNFFLAEVLDRRREIGLLRSVAMTRRQLMKMFTGEALILGTLGGVLAALYAWPVARLLVTRSTRIVSGWSLAFAFPYWMVLVIIVVSAATSMVAAYYPSRRAAAVRNSALVVIE